MLTILDLDLRPGLRYSSFSVGLIQADPKVSELSASFLLGYASGSESLIAHLLKSCDLHAVGDVDLKISLVDLACSSSSLRSGQLSRLGSPIILSRF